VNVASGHGTRPTGHSGDMHPDTAVVELPLRPPAHRASPRAVAWWRLRAAAGALALVVPELVLLLVTGGAGWAGALLAVTLVAGTAYVAAVPPWLYRISRWEVTDRAVYTLHGWLVREWRIAPISRVQTVDTERGPLQQLLGLANVTVTTASARGAVRIRGLAHDDAAELARLLTETTHATPGDAT
jgi:membrane protein YdbS with pleckstrin-like domain